VRRGEAVRLREGESLVIRPGEQGAAHDQTAGAGYRESPQPLHAVTGPDPDRQGNGTESQQASDPDEIEADIERTRAEMSGTIDAIQQRLNPDNLKEEAKETASELAEHAKQAAREAVQHAVHEARMHARDAIQDVRDTVRDATIGRVEQMVRTVGDTTEDTRYGIVETIKQNPIPAALASIGLAWLFMNRQSAPRRTYLEDRSYGQSRVYRDRDYDRDTQYRSYREGDDRYGATTYRSYSTPPAYGSNYEQGREEAGMIDRTKERVGQMADQTGSMVGRAGDTIGQAAGQAGDTVGRVAGQVGETASSLASQAQQTAGQLANQAQYRARRVEDQVSRTMNENPLALGAVALALGTAVGLAVPTTQRENELFGQARDTLMERAQDMAQETMEKVQEIAGEAGHTVQREAKSAGLTQ
jgi:vacuolar-type H+-ATPase subunit H